MPLSLRGYSRAASPFKRLDTICEYWDFLPVARSAYPAPARGAARNAMQRPRNDFPAPCFALFNRVCSIHLRIEKHATDQAGERAAIRAVYAVDAVCHACLGPRASECDCRAQLKSCRVFHAPRRWLPPRHATPRPRWFFCRPGKRRGRHVTPTPKGGDSPEDLDSCATGPPCATSATGAPEYHMLRQEHAVLCPITPHNDPHSIAATRPQF